MAVSISISITQNSQNIANNTSNVTVKVNASWTNASYNRAQKSGWLKINGTTYDFTSSFNDSYTASGSKTLFTKTVDIAHASDGTKTLSCSASYTSGVSSGTVTASATKTLTTIARKSTLTASNGTLGVEQTLKVARQASSFTHTITYSCGDASGTICTKSGSTSIAWTPPMSLASQNITGITVSVVLTITTYSGTTSLGSNTRTITCSIPSSVAPTCTLTVTDPTGISSKYGSYVKGLSKFAVTIKPTFAYGSSIRSWRTTANGATYTTNRFTTDVIKASGDVTINATVTDRRGRKGTASATRTVINYYVPAIAKLTVKRCNEDGVENDQGEYIQVNFSGSVTSLNNLNTASYLLRYKRSSETAYTEVNFDQYDNVYTVIDGSYIFPADSSSSYNVEFVITDSHNTTRRATTASTAFTLMHFRAEGDGIGIGKLAEEADLLDIGMPTRFNQPVSGNVVGMNRLPGIPANSDLNDYMETGSYAVYSNAIASTIANIPIDRAGRLEVYSSTGEGIRVTQWSYLRQRYIPYNRDNAVWERDISRSETNVWTYGEWWRSTLTPNVSNKVYHEQKVLWGDSQTSGMYMNATQSVTLAENISDQPEGIELVFCYYNGTDNTNWGWQTFRVSKKIVELEPGGAHIFKLTNSEFGSVGTKYLYINDGSIVGHADNEVAGTSGSGITYANNRFVLRYVIGV